MLSVTLLNFVILNAAMLSVILLNVVMLSVVSPYYTFQRRSGLIFPKLLTIILRSFYKGNLAIKSLT
jgi:hypothetical protein